MERLNQKYGKLPRATSITSNFVIGSFVLKLNIESMEVSVFPFKLQRLPTEFMADVALDVGDGADAAAK